MSKSFTTLGELVHWATLMAEEFEYWDDADAIRSFGKTWRDLQNLRLEDIQLSRIPEPDSDDTGYLPPKPLLSSAYGEMHRF